MTAELTRRYQQELKRTREAVRNHAEKVWRALPEHRDAQIDPFLKAVVPTVRAGQVRAVALTNAYLAQKTGNTKLYSLKVDDLVGSAARNGIDPDLVYRRPFETVWGAVEKIGYAAAIAKGMSRLLSTVDMDVQMASRNATLAVGAASEGRIVGWIRVADPSCCDFCQMLDGVKTGPDEPQPLHNNCGCTADPIEVNTPAAEDINGSFAPGEEIDDVLIEEHGELGPVITFKDNNFTSLADLDMPRSYLRDLGT